MTVSNTRPNQPQNNNNITTIYRNYGSTEKSRTTDYGTINPEANKITKYNYLNSQIDRDNNTNNVRITHTEAAIRGVGFDLYNFEFDQGLPLSSNYRFCDPSSAIVFSNAGNQYSRKTERNQAYPFTENLSSVRDSIQNGPYGKNYSGSCVQFTCPPGLSPDPVTGFCVPPLQCVPPPVTPCPEPDLALLKPTIYGYVFYVAAIRDVQIPNIGPKRARCGGGHACNRTVFQPQLKLNDNSYVYASNYVSLDNVGGHPAFNPIPGWTPINGLDRADSFTFTVDPTKIDDTCQVFLVCKTGGSCHNDVTMMCLVGQRSDNDEYVLIFADCVAPGNLSTSFLGDNPCNEEELPNPCVTPTDTPPPPPTQTPPPTPTEPPPPPPTSTPEPPTPTPEPPTPTPEPPTPTPEPPTPTPIPPSPTPDGSTPTQPTPTPEV